MGLWHPEMVRAAQPDAAQGQFLGVTFPPAWGTVPLLLGGSPSAMCSSPVEVRGGCLLFEPSPCQEEENTAKSQREQDQHCGGG